MATLPAIRVGYEYIDPGPPRRSSLLDDPPVVTSADDLVAAHADWRRRVEADEAVLTRRHQQQVVWYPVLNPARQAVIPLLGGTTESWDSLIPGLVVAAIDGGFHTAQVANLSGRPVLRSLRSIAAKARHARVRLDSVSASGSSLDLYATQNFTDLASYVVDVLRVTADAQGRRDSAREKADLSAVAALIDPPVTIVKLTAALDVALGAINPQAGSLLTRDEERALRDFHHNVVAVRRQTADRLDGLHADLRELSRYGYDSRRAAPILGAATATPIQVRALDVDQGQAVHELEMSRALIAGAVARAFGRQTNKLELLIVIGAEKLSVEILDSLKASAEQIGKQLVLLFGEITPEAERTIGSGGSGLVGFMRLPNAKDAEVAARHFGREFTFVVNGITITEGETEEWNSSYSHSSNSSYSRSTNFGWGFGRSVSRSFGTSDTNTQGQGHAVNRSTAQQISRVHDYVIEPEEFQHLEEYAVVLVDGKKATLVNCDYRLRNHPQALKP